MDYFGRRNSLMSIAIPQIISWFMILYAKNAYHLMFSRFLAGFAGGGLYIAIPLFISEIASDRVRGRLGSAFVFSSTLGVLMAYIIGTYLDYDIIPWLYLPFPIIFLIGSVFMPESPMFLTQKLQFNDAETSYRFYRGLKRQQELGEDEIMELETMKKLLSTEKTDNKLSKEDFLTRSAIKSFVICVGLMFLEQFCGCFSLLFYASTIFEGSESSFTANESSIVIGIIQIIGAYVSTLLVDKSGRKFLISFSAFGISLGMFIFAMHGFLTPHMDLTFFKWIPLISFGFVIFIGNIGVLTLPFLVMSEVVPPKIKSYVYTFCLTMSWFFILIVFKLIDIAVDLIGMHGLMAIFSVNSLIGGIFVLIILPETKGKSIEAIMQLMEK